MMKHLLFCPVSVVFLAIVMGLAGHAKEATPDRTLGGGELPKPLQPVSSEKEPAGTIEIDCSGGVSIKLALIPSGEFLMGSSEREKKRDTDEGPQHRVWITKPFYMGVCEVTQPQYKAIMGNNPSHFKDESNPVECVSWNDAVEFCKRLSSKTGATVRLPTEAEWEYACRAGTKTPFSTGRAINTNLANYNGDFRYFDRGTGVNRKKTTPVGSFSPNSWDLFDMHGNVWEWCQDWYEPDYYARSPTNDPAGPDEGQRRVMRGGSWIVEPRTCRSAVRYGYDPSNRYNFIGFRMVREIVQAQEAKPETPTIAAEKSQPPPTPRSADSK